MARDCMVTRREEGSAVYTHTRMESMVTRQEEGPGGLHTNGIPQMGRVVERWHGGSHHSGSSGKDAVWSDIAVAVGVRHCVVVTGGKGNVLSRIKFVFWMTAHVRGRVGLH